MRTIVQVSPYYPPRLGGLERVAANLCERLAERHEVRVLTTALGAGPPGATAPRPDAGSPDAGGSLSVRRYRAAELAHTPLSPGLALALLRVPRTAVLHLHCAHALLPELVALSARLRRRRYLIHFHLDVDASGRLGRLLPLYKKHVLGRVLRSAAAVIALTPDQAAFLRTAYRVPGERVFVVPNGVGEEYFRPVPEVPAGSLPAASPDPDPPLRLLFVGRLSAQKNVGRLLDAMARLDRAARPVRLRIVGDGELRAELEARAARLGLGTAVRFAGELHGPELIAAYAASDAFVLPSDREGMPLVALEAMASALPVLATDVPGNRELLDGVGLLVPPDPAALAAGIDRLAGDPELRLRLAAAGARAARARSWASVAEQVERVYAEAGL